MILVVDVGNTRIKAAVFEGATLSEIFVFSKIELQKNIQNILKNFEKITDMVVS